VHRSRLTLAVPSGGARTRKEGICLCKLYKGGRCKFHGGLSTGEDPRGKARAAANLPNARRSQPAPVNLTPEEQESVEP
jgi:hypothetical protein